MRSVVDLRHLLIMMPSNFIKALDLKLTSYILTAERFMVARDLLSGTLRAGLMVCAMEMIEEWGDLEDFLG